MTYLNFVLGGSIVTSDWKIICSWLELLELFFDTGHVIFRCQAIPASAAVKRMCYHLNCLRLTSLRRNLDLLWFDGGNRSAHHNSRSND